LAQDLLFKIDHCGPAAYGLGSGACWLAMAMVSEDSVRQEVARVSRLARTEVRRGAAFASGTYATAPASGDVGLGVENRFASRSVERFQTSPAASPLRPGAVEALSPIEAFARRIGLDGSRPRVMAAPQGMEALASRDNLWPAGATSSMRAPMPTSAGTSAFSSLAAPPGMPPGTSMSDLISVSAAPSLPSSASAPPGIVENQPGLISHGRADPASPIATLAVAERLAHALADRLRQRGRGIQSAPAPALDRQQTPPPTSTFAATNSAVGQSAAGTEFTRSTSPGAVTGAAAERTRSTSPTSARARRLESVEKLINSSPLRSSAEKPGVGAVAATVDAQSIEGASVSGERSGGGITFALSDQAGSLASSPQKIADAAVAADTMQDVIRELSSRLAAETEAAASRQEEMRALMVERDSAQAEVLVLLQRQAADEDQQRFSCEELQRWQAACVEMPMLQAQLQTSELQEGAARERCMQVDGWLRGAAAEAQEALAMARQMTAAEVTCLAEVGAASEARASALAEMRALSGRLRTAESSGGGLVLYKEARGEAEAARQWREKALGLQSMEAAVQEKALRREEDSEARIAELTVQVRTAEARDQARAKSTGWHSIVAKARADMVDGTGAASPSSERSGFSGQGVSPSRFSQSSPLPSDKEQVFRYSERDLLAVQPNLAEDLYRN